MNKAYIHTITKGGAKSIPLHSFPDSAWQEVLKLSDNSDVYQYYLRIPTLRRSVDIIADSVSSVPFNQGDFEGKARANFAQLFNQITADLMLYGRSYVVCDEYGQDKELRRLLPSSIKPKYSEKHGLTGFERTLNEGIMHYDSDELAPVFLPPRNREVGYGASPCITALSEAKVIESSDDFSKSFLDSGGVSPSMIQIEGFEVSTESEKQRTKSWFERFFRGSNKERVNKPLVTGKSIDVKPLGDNSKVLKELVTITEEKRKGILVSLGVPESMLIGGSSNYASAKSERRNFYTSTIAPLLRLIESSLNPFLAYYGLPALKFNERKLDVFSEDRSQASHGAIALTSAGVPLVTALELVGFDLTPEMLEQLERLSVNQRALAQDKSFHFASASVTDEQSSAPEREREREREREPERVERLKEPESEKSMLTDLEKFKNKALNRFKAGKSLDFSFDSDYIPDVLTGAILGSLQEVETADEIKNIFEQALDVSGNTKHNHKHQHNNEVYP